MRGCGAGDMPDRSSASWRCAAGARTARLDALWQSETDEQSNASPTYTAFARWIEVTREDNLAFLREAKQKGRRVFGFGAPAKGNTLLNYFGIGPQYLDCPVEKNACLPSRVCVLAGRP